MEELRRKFVRESASQRKSDLIAATLSLIAKSGVRAATVRGIAQEAGVTLGLIRHYFSSKDELIHEAYKHHMNWMTDMTMSASSTKEGTAINRLASAVSKSLSPTISSPEMVALWAAFLNQIRIEPRMREMHEQTYREFRDQLEALIADVFREINRPTTPAELRQLAIASNAVIDGLWIEGGALPSEFRPDELATIGLKSVSAILGVELIQKEEKP